MKKLSVRRKHFLINNSKKTFRKKIKRNYQFRKKRHLNLLANFQNRAKEREQLRIKKRRKEINIMADENFSLLVHTNNVISFISKLKSYKNVAHEVKKINIDLENVKSIDIGTISLLLSSIKELNIFGIDIGGNLPKHEDCKQKILNSGYLNHMTQMSKSLNKIMNEPRIKNLLLMSGKDKSESRKVGESIKGAIEELTGTSSHYPPIYGIIQEMNGNSVEHAYKDKKHWILGINHDKENGKIIFTFTDNGFGILKTIKRRFNQKVFDLLNWKNDQNILEGIFDKEYNSRFKKQYNRNKGLPVIKKAQMQNKINNLLVISNSVYLKLDDNSSFSLDNKFSGTFYYWELDLKTYKNGKTIN